MSINKDLNPSSSSTPKSVDSDEPVVAGPKTKAEAESEAWEATSVERMIFGPSQGSRHTRAVPKTGTLLSTGLSNKWETAPEKDSWAEPSVETMIFGPSADSAEASPDTHHSLDSSAPVESVSEMESREFPTDVLARGAIETKRPPAGETEDSDPRRLGTRPHPSIPMRKPLTLMVDGDDITYKGTLVRLARDGFTCRIELPVVEADTDVVARLKVPGWGFVPRALSLPATLERQNGRECAFRFRTFEEKVQTRFDAYWKRALVAHQKLQTAQGGVSALAEAFRMVRMSLEPMESARPRVVLVTSSVAGEGKTFLASGLAAVLAKEGRRVLLVDADLYRPGLHQILGLKALDGVNRLLTSTAREDLDELIQEPIHGLSVLTGGASGVPAELFAESSVSGLMSRLRGAGFDIVIVDSPPLLQAAGAIPLARAADEVVLAVRSGRSRLRDVRETESLLQRNGVELRGVILNDYAGLDKKSYGYGYAPLQADLDEALAAYQRDLDTDTVTDNHDTGTTVPFEPTADPVADDAPRAETIDAPTAPETPARVETTSLPDPYPPTPAAEPVQEPYREPEVATDTAEQWVDAIPAAAEGVELPARQSRDLEDGELPGIVEPAPRASDAELDLTISAPVSETVMPEPTRRDEVDSERPVDAEHGLRRLRDLQEQLRLDENISGSIATLWNSLQLQSVDKLLRSVLVASAQPEEGKTTVTVGLALSLVEAGKRVILVDADVRRPSIHDYLGLEDSPGLVNVLRNDTSAEDALKRVLTLDAPSGGGTLRVLSSGPASSFLIDWVPRMEKLLAELIDVADVVLVDSPPALAVSDASFMAGMVDGVLLVLNTGNVSQDHAKLAKERLEETGGRVLGAALNRFDEKRHGPAAYPYHNYYR